MNKIIRPVTSDGMCGYDEHGQFVISWCERERTTMIFGRDVRHEKCAICLRGWEATSDSFRDQDFWRLLDTVVHQSCLIRHEGFVERANFSRAMVRAKLRFKGFRVIQNGYWPGTTPWSQKPWYEADLSDYAATIVIGSRKRVTHVELRAWDASS